MELHLYYGYSYCNPWCQLCHSLEHSSDTCPLNHCPQSAPSHSPLTRLHHKPDHHLTIRYAETSTRKPASKGKKYRHTYSPVPGMEWTTHTNTMPIGIIQQSRGPHPSYFKITLLQWPWKIVKLRGDEAWRNAVLPCFSPLSLPVFFLEI